GTGRGVQDDTASRLAHHWHNEARGHEMSPYVEAPGAVESRNLDLLQVARDLSAGMVVQDVDATVALGDGPDATLERTVIGNVEHQRFSAAASLADTGGRLFRPSSILVGQHDMRALARHNGGAGFADARSGPGDDGNVVLKDHGFLHVSLPFSCRASESARRGSVPATPPTLWWRRR